MTELSTEARETLNRYGISADDWTRYFMGDSTWQGDSCGCPDDRCIGHHHAKDEECGCVSSLIRDYLTDTRDKGH